MVSGKAFCVIAMPHGKLQHPVQVRDNYCDNSVQAKYKHEIHYKTICET